MPPGKPLSEVIDGSGPAQGRSQQFTQTLIRLSDTLDYLHRNRVTLQRFNTKDISIGSFGEVVLHNLALATHHRNASDDLSFNDGRQSDLKNLAELGLRMWTGSRRTDEISIRDWDAQAQKLPIELQVILDRAFLERGGKYPNPSHFSRDLLNFQEGLPPENRKDDLLFRLKGILFKRKQETMALMATLAICFLLILAQNHPIQKVSKNLERLHQKKDQHTQMVSSIDDQLSELDVTYERRNGELKSYEEKLREQRGQSQAMKDLRNQAERKRQSIEKKIAELNSRKEVLIDAETQWNKKREAWETRIQKQSESILQRGQQLSKVGDLPTRPFSIIELREHPDHLQKYVDALDLSPGWLNEYLNNISIPETPKKTILPILGELKHFAQDPNSERILLLHGRITLLNTVSLLTQSFDLPQLELKSAFFSPREDFFYGNNERALLTFSPESTMRTIPIEIEGDFITLLPHGSPRQIHAWNRSNFFSGGVAREIGAPPSYNPASVSLEDGTLQVVSSKDGRFWRIHNEGVDLLPLKSRVLSFDTPPDLWFSQLNDGLAIKRGAEVTLYPWPDHFEPMTPGSSYQLPEKFQRADELVGDISENQLWLRKGDDFLFLSPTTPTPLTQSGLGSRLLWWKSPNLFCLDEQGLRIQEISEEGMTRSGAPPELSNEHLKEWRENAPPGLDFRGGWSFLDDPLVLVLNGKRSIEVWSQETWSRVGHLATSEEDLKGLSFRDSDNAIFGLSMKGNWIKF